MGSKGSPRVIGAFVVGGIALVMAGVMFFGGGKVFQEKTPYVIFFESSAQGLNVGAPVVFRGVQVGQVAKVKALYDPKQATIHVKVLVELVRRHRAGHCRGQAAFAARGRRNPGATGAACLIAATEFCDGPVAGQSRLLSRHTHQAARSRPDVSRTASRAHPN